MHAKDTWSLPEQDQALAEILYFVYGFTERYFGAAAVSLLRTLWVVSLQH